MSVPAGYSAFGTAISLGLGRVSQFVLRLPKAHDRDASDRFLPPNTLLTSTRTRLLPDHRQGLRPAYTKEVAPLRTEESSVSRRSNRFSGSPGIVGSFRPDSRYRFHERSWRSTSDTSVANPHSLRVAFLCELAAARAAKIVSTPKAVTPSKISRSKVPSLGKQLTTPHALYRSPIVNHRRPCDFAHRASDCRLLFAHDVPPERLQALRGFLW